MSTIANCIERLERMADEVTSKVHRADNGTLSFPSINHGSAVLYPVGYFSEYPHLGLLNQVEEDDLVTDYRMFLFTEKAIAAAIRVIRAKEEPLTEDHSLIHIALGQVRDQGDFILPNEEDKSVFTRVMTYQS